MRIVFWQNCISPHQMPFITRLADDPRVDEVVVVAEVDVPPERRQMGWDSLYDANNRSCRIYLHPGDDDIRRLLDQRAAESWHIFMGIRAFSYVFHCLRLSMDYPVRRAMMSERPNTYALGLANGKPLWLHRLRFMLHDRRYAGHIERVFAIGAMAADYFGSASKHWQVSRFAYCTETPVIATPPPHDQRLRLLFAGSLEWHKAPLTLLKSLLMTRDGDAAVAFHLDIIGNGSQRRSLQQFIATHCLANRIDMVGTVAHNRMAEWMGRSDVLVLPSVYDGWGAVVNEALLAGSYVIVSDACGAADLLGDSRLGRVFHAGDAKGLARIIADCHCRLNSIRADRQWRRQWAIEHISGPRIARYFIDCLCGDDIEPLY